MHEDYKKTKVKLARIKFYFKERKYFVNNTVKNFVSKDNLKTQEVEINILYAVPNQHEGKVLFDRFNERIVMTNRTTKLPSIEGRK